MPSSPVLPSAETPPSKPASSESSDISIQPERKPEDYQLQGALRQRWLSNTTLPDDEPCCNARSTLTLEQLERDGWKFGDNLGWRIDESSTGFREWKDGVHNHAVDIGLLEADPSLGDAIYRETWLELANTEDWDFAYWGGRVRRGMIFINEVKSGELPSTPYISEVSQAVYTRDFPIETLRYVFVHNIMNDDTLAFLHFYLYGQESGILWNACYEYRVWEFGTPQYQGLLGTTLGKLVAALVLGAFEPGTRRIARIVTGGTHMVSIRFDIEVIAQVEEVGNGM